MKKNKFKEFFATSWAIDNRTSIFVLVVFISVLGIMSYQRIPKEQFPEIVIPYIIINTPYPGTSPADIENLVTRPIEKELKSIADVKNITSKSMQDFSSIVVEFELSVTIEEAKQRVRDAVDKAKADLPNDLPDDPQIMDIDLSELPIMFINITGNYDLDRLKKFADIAQDHIETLQEITRVDIVGALEREIKVDVDMYKMQAAKVTFSDIERAISSENVTVSAGTITTYGMKRTIRVVGQFKNIETLKNIILTSSSGALVSLKDIADIQDSFKEQESFSRLNQNPVITLNVIKKSGQNLIEASDKIKDILNNELIGKAFPDDLNVTITNDMSRYTRNTLEELNNTIIIGFILVTFVLMFFMGFSNAFFVGLSVPLSMAVAYIVMPGFGFTMNMMVMFAFIFALGIVVDDAIVVIENTHRIHRNHPDIKIAAKMAAGEVFLPILSGTFTTLAPFFPLAFWPGIVGQFMYYMPVTVILTLFASLFVAYIFNPVFAVSFMKHEYDKPDRKADIRRMKKWGIIMLLVAAFFYLTGVTGMGNFTVFAIILYITYVLVLKKAVHNFQNKVWPAVMRLYDRQLRFFLQGLRPYWLLTGVIALFFLTIFLVAVIKPNVLFFPNNEPNNVFVYVKMPEGTDQLVTDSVTRVAEKRVFEILGKNNPLVESVISNVAVGAGEDGNFQSGGIAFNRGKINISFIESKYRKGFSTQFYLDEFRKKLKGIAGAEITVGKNRMGPPTGKPINIEVSSENLEELITDADRFKNYLDSLQIPGIEELKSDFQERTPEILIDIDRERANREGISTGQIGMVVRTAIYGNEVSKFKVDEDEFPIQLRYNKSLRDNIDALINLKVTYRDMNTGHLRSIPLSTVAKIKYTSNYGGINRKNLKRVITLSSNVLSGYTANEIVAVIKKLAKTFHTNPGVNIELTGEQEDQAETTQFLGTAMIIALGVIFFILITQFNSLSKSLIILSEVIFSIVGVLLGVIIFNLDIVIIMMGLGVVALGGIVVRNGILIVEFTDRLKEKGLRTRDAIIQAGKTRITPVLLTATATMLGLVPLAIGLNINFETLFTQLNPHIYFGGDNVMFWGPLSWTIIFGLSFATFLTLLFVPAMYLIAYRMKLRMTRRSFRKKLHKQQMA